MDVQSKEKGAVNYTSNGSSGKPNHLLRSARPWTLIYWSRNLWCTWLGRLGERSPPAGVLQSASGL